MKRFMFWLLVTAAAVFVIDWGVVGLKLLSGEYDITVGAYIGLACWIVIIVSVIFRRFSNRCPHCGKYQSGVGKYCTHCGRELGSSEGD